MSPESQRIAIAEACGWHNICRYDYSGRNYGAWPAHIAAKARASDERNSGLQGLKCDREQYNSFFNSLPANVAFQCPEEYQNKPIPDYLNSLDAMHEAEKVLSEQQFFAYCDTLSDVLDLMNEVHGTRMAWRIHAAAKARAEAFLKAIGKWLPDSPQ